MTKYMTPNERLHSLNDELDPHTGSLPGLRRALRRSLPPRCHKDFDAALRGNLDAAEHLVMGAPNEHRGFLAFYFGGAAHTSPTKHLETFRAVLRTAWLDDGEIVRATMGGADGVESLFLTAKFPLPDHIPDPVTIYRGTTGMSLQQSARGGSWSLDKGCAAFFACHYVRRVQRDPVLVISAEVPRSKVLWADDERGEQEVLAFHVEGARIDGTLEEWRAMMPPWHVSREKEAA